MRIAVVNNFFPPRVGGSSHMADILAREYVAQGHEVIVLTAAYQGAPREEMRNGYKVVRLPAMKMPKLGLSIDFDMTFTTMKPGNYRRIFRLLDDFKPDIIHQHGQIFDLTWLTGWYARRRKVPTVLTIHTLLISEKKLYSAIFRMLDALVVRPILKMYKPRFVILAKFDAEYCLQRYGTTEAESDYYPIALDIDHLSTAPAKDIRAEHNIGDAPLIVSLGHIIPLRDRLPLVEAMPAVLAKYPDTKVIVAGRLYYDAFLKRAKELGIEDRFILTGAVPKADVPAYFAAADIVTHDLNGGCGTASLEAMASGRATIASVREDHYPGIELRNGDNVLLVPPNDSAKLAETLLALLDDPEHRARIAARERDMVRDNFGVDTVAEEHLRTFDKLVAARTGAKDNGNRK